MEKGNRIGRPINKFRRTRKRRAPLNFTLAANEETMEEKLFIYRTLGPGRPNEHVLKAIGGVGKNATVRGKLRQEGWGAEMGYPGIDLDKKWRRNRRFPFHLREPIKSLESA